MKLSNGVEIELVEGKCRTCEHCCAGCYFHENDLICDDVDLSLDACIGKRIYKEVKHEN